MNSWRAVRMDRITGCDTDRIKPLSGQMEVTAKTGAIHKRSLTRPEQRKSAQNLPIIRKKGAVCMHRVKLWAE